MGSGRWRAAAAASAPRLSSAPRWVPGEEWGVLGVVGSRERRGLGAWGYWVGWEESRSRLGRGAAWTRVGGAIKGQRSCHRPANRCPWVRSGRPYASLSTGGLRGVPERGCPPPIPP